MEAVNETIAALGTPVFLRAVGDAHSRAAVIARWRHGDARIKVAALGTALVVIRLQDRVPVSRRTSREVSSGLVRAGSILVVPADQPTEVNIEGEADVLQVFLSTHVLETAAGGRAASFAVIDAHDGVIHAVAMQLLVAATRRDLDDSLLLEAGIHRIAARLLERDRRPLKLERSGLARSAYRRVDELIAAALEDGALRSPSLAQLAGAANRVGFSVRTFFSRRTATPGAPMPHQVAYISQRQQHRRTRLRRLEERPLIQSGTLALPQLPRRMHITVTRTC